MTKSIDNIIGAILLVYGINSGFTSCTYGGAIFGIMFILSGVFLLACNPINDIYKSIKNKLK